MAVIEKFLGQCVEIPEDRKYFTKQGLWAKPQDQEMILGFTEPALVLAGGVRDLDWLVSEKMPVRRGQDVVFVITGKILYIDTPLKGTIFLLNMTTSTIIQRFTAQTSFALPIQTSDYLNNLC